MDDTAVELLRIWDSANNSHAGNADKIRRKPRILVAIASFGTGHLAYLKEIIGVYHSLPIGAHVVVLSDSPKDLGNDVEVIVGLPSRNPWTLPFAHKAVFARDADQYDLFIYSEDDIGVSEKNIRAFLEATSQLAEDEIAGFLRYEVKVDGTRLLTEPWNHFHWKPASVGQRGAYTIAEFTNEHAGFYILTKWQLKQAIASGGFLRPPYRARYSWPETAATDPYTSCGFHKVICISALGDFLVHHLPNRYIDQLPVSLEDFERQIDTLLMIRDGKHPATILCEVEPKAWFHKWQKTYFEKPNDDTLELVPRSAQTILSVGCGWGATEKIIQDRGARVTVLPLDSVVGAEAARIGFEVVHGALDTGLAKLADRRFDCVLMTNLLHLQRNPSHLLQICLRLVAEKGTIVLSGPNLRRLPIYLKRMARVDPYQKLGDYDQSGLSLSGPNSFESVLAANGFRPPTIRWVDTGFSHSLWARLSQSLGSITAREWLLQARRHEV